MRARWIPILLALAAPAHADRNDELSIGGATRLLRSASANALTDADLAGASYGYARRLVLVTPAISLWAEAGVEVSSTQGTMFQALTTEVGVVAFTGGLRLRDQLHRRVAASARVDAGTQRVELEISAPSSPDASGHRWGAIAAVAAGLDVYVVAHPAFGLGVRAELGYAFAQAQPLALRRDTPGDALRLPMLEASIGALDLSGPTFAVSLLGAF